jgi:hypothetical protein
LVERLRFDTKPTPNISSVTLCICPYNKLGIRALIKPHKFPRGLPKPARTPNKLRKRVDREGTLPPRPPPVPQDPESVGLRRLELV